MTIPKAATPFVTGAIAGALVAIVLGFANDWVVTAKAKEIAVQDAWVTAQASVCASMAESHLKETKSTVSLDGYQSDARKARDDLARAFAVTLPGEEAVSSIVVTACAQMLNKPKA